jgi:hypothetical protein
MVTTEEELDQEQHEEEEHEEEQEEQEQEEIRDPVAKARAETEKAARLSNKLTQVEGELAELRKTRDEHPDAQALRASRVEAAFLRHVIDSGERYDLEAMWDLARVRGFLDTLEVSDDGEVSGMDDAISRVLDRYPWLCEDAPATTDAGTKTRTAPPPRKRDNGPAKPLESTMRERFPALRKGAR